MSGWGRGARTAAVLAIAVLTLLAGGLPALAQAPAARLVLAPVPLTPMPDGFTLAAVGDLIYLRPMLPTLERRAPDMLKILRQADAAFGNFETTAADLGAFKGAPQAESGGISLLADPRVPGDVKAMGFGLVSVANNHATDWGVEGLQETAARLDAAGVVHAGTGRNLSAARAPRYLDIGPGRIALVAASSTFTPMSRAGDGVGQIPGRPGVNALRFDRIGLVSPEDLAVLRRLAQAPASATTVRFNGAEYRAAAAAGDGVSFTYDLNTADVAANLLALRQGRQNSNFAIFSLHAHEPSNESETPADFLQGLAHKAIDQGADAFIAHGPHQLRGVEIYRGRPIFYSLGNFAMMNNSLDGLAAETLEEYGVAAGSGTVPEILQARNAREFSNRSFFESVIAVSRYAKGEVVEIRLYPIDLGVADSGAARGVPRLAEDKLGREILERLQRLSAPYGTRIAIEGGVGVWRRGAGDFAVPR